MSDGNSSPERSNPRSGSTTPPTTYTQSPEKPQLRECNETETSSQQQPPSPTFSPRDRDSSSSDAEIVGEIDSLKGIVMNGLKLAITVPRGRLGGYIPDATERDGTEQDGTERDDTEKVLKKWAEVPGYLEGVAQSLRDVLDELGDPLHNGSKGSDDHSPEGLLRSMHREDLSSASADPRELCALQAVSTLAPRSRKHPQERATTYDSLCSSPKQADSDASPSKVRRRPLANYARDMGIMPRLSSSKEQSLTGANAWPCRKSTSRSTRKEEGSPRLSKSARESRFSRLGGSPTSSKRSDDVVECGDEFSELRDLLEGD